MQVETLEQAVQEIERLEKLCEKLNSELQGRKTNPSKAVQNPRIFWSFIGAELCRGIYYANNYGRGGGKAKGRKTG